LAGRLVLGTAGGGIWTSDNGGASWTARSDNAPSLAIGSLAIDPANPLHLIAGTGEEHNCGDCFWGAGVLSSTNGGTSWTTQNPGGVFTGAHIGQVAISPTNSNTMYAATDNGLYITTNGGTTWAKPTDPSYTQFGGDVTAVVIDPANAQIVYMAGTGYVGASNAIIAESTDGGLTWTAANSGVSSNGGSYVNIALAIAPSSPNQLYAAVGSDRAELVFSSSTAGSSWTNLGAPDYTGDVYAYGPGTSGEQGFYDNVIAVDPTNPAHVLAGGETVVESRNSGASWVNVNGGGFFSGATNRIHPDQHALFFRTNGSVLIGDDGGVYSYNPVANTVSNLNSYLNTIQFYGGFNEVGGEVLAGSQDNASDLTTTSSPGPWTQVGGGDGGSSALTPNDKSIGFIEMDESLYESTDSFATLNQVLGGASNIFTPPLLVVPNKTTPNEPAVFFGYNGGIERSTNPNPASSSTWTTVWSYGSGYVTALAAAPTNPNVIYAGTDTGLVLVSTDGGTTWVTLPGNGLSEQWVTGISVNPGNPHAIVVTVSGGAMRAYPDAPYIGQYVWTTSPTTGSWTNITGNMPATAATEHVIYDHGAFIAATDRGVFAAATGNGSLTNWQPLASGLPAVQVVDLFLDPTTGALYALTHGRGAWLLASPPLFIRPPFAPAGKNGVAYSVTFAATGGVAPYAWSVSAGALPPGLSLNASSGVVSGTPTAVGSYRFTLTVSDAKGHTGAKAFTITIGA
jgi:hypothetical protein